MALITDLIQAIPAILTQMKGRDLKPQKQATGQLDQLANAQMNMDSPVFQNLYKQNKDAGQQNLAQTIAEISGQNRKLNTMGRRSLLDQERGGETIFRNLIASQQGIDDNARKNTFSQLGRASDAYTGVYNAENKNSEYGYDNDLKKVSAYGNIADVIRGATGQKPKEAITWNTPTQFDPNDIAAATAPKSASELSMPMGGDLQAILKKILGG